MAQYFFHRISQSVIISFICLSIVSLSTPTQLDCVLHGNSLFICLVHHHNPSAMSDTVVQCLTQNRCSKYLLNKLTTMEGLAPRVSRLNIGMSIRRAVLGSLFRTICSLKFMKLFLFLSPPPLMILLKTTYVLKNFLRYPSVKILRYKITVLYPICTLE